MRIGTKSVLFGAHAFWLHPWVLAFAWWKLYGFPIDPRLWVAFIVHDLGYFGKPNMDGPEGEEHPAFGARIMGALFGPQWFAFSYYHSRYLAKRDGAHYSKLCVADKLAIALLPAWIYLPMVRATGEIQEYMKDAERAHPDMPLDKSSQRAWYASVQDYCRRWAMQHKDGIPDTWTATRKDSENTYGEHGVWR